MFGPQKIKFSDLALISKIMVGTKTNLIIFDPLGQVIYDEEGNFKKDAKNVFVNFGQDVTTFKEFRLDDFDAILDFGSVKNIQSFKAHSFQVFSTKAKDVKWITKSEDRSNSILNFLNTDSVRAKVIRTGFKALNWMRLSHLISTSFTVYNQGNKLHFENNLPEISYDNYSIFCGVPGVYRKPVIQLVENNKPVSFVKLAVSQNSHIQIEKERNILRKVNQIEFTNLCVPSILETKSEISLATSPLFKTSNSKINDNILIESLIQINFAQQKHVKFSLSKTAFDINKRLEWLKNNGNNTDLSLIKKLELVYENLDKHQYLFTSIAHGDFTPWNIILGEKPQIIDWEMAENERPLFYDLFHFILSKELFINRNTDGLHALKKIKKVLASPPLTTITNKYRVNIETNLKIYLLHKISEQLVLFNKQHIVHHEHEMLRILWMNILDHFLPQTTTVDQRRAFLQQIEGVLQAKSYAAIKFLHKRFAEIPETSDLDLIIAKKDIDSLIKFCKTHPYVEMTKVFQDAHMHTIKLFFKNGSFLSIDLIHELSRKGVKFIKIEDYIASAEPVNNVNRPTLYFDFLYLIYFYNLNGQNIPAKYKNYLRDRLNSEEEKETLLTKINAKTGLNYSQLDFYFLLKDSDRTLLQKQVKQSNSAFGLLIRRFRYLTFTLKRMLTDYGKVITFSGVDGAGKTTVLTKIQTELTKTYRKEVVILRHRPGILPIISTLKYGTKEKAENAASNRLPRQGKNKSFLSSLLRFGYYYMDYIFGQVFVFFKYRLRGKIIIYDRYYFDFINDAKRSNIQLNRKFIKLLYALVHKPKFNFYLYNTPQVILSRKKELKAEDIIQLNTNYAQLFNELQAQQSNSEYIQIKNDYLDETVNNIMQRLKIIL